MSKKVYDVADGVAWVNGQKVPERRQVELTEAEALFDKSMGRITEHTPEKGGKPTVKRQGKKNA